MGSPGYRIRQRHAEQQAAREQRAAALAERLREHQRDKTKQPDIKDRVDIDLLRE